MWQNQQESEIIHLYTDSIKCHIFSYISSICLRGGSTGKHKCAEAGTGNTNCFMQQKRYQKNKKGNYSWWHPFTCTHSWPHQLLCLVRDKTFCFFAAVVMTRQSEWTLDDWTLAEHPPYLPYCTCSDKRMNKIKRSFAMVFPVPPSSWAMTCSSSKFTAQPLGGTASSCCDIQRQQSLRTISSVSCSSGSLHLCICAVLGGDRHEHTA